MRGAKITTIGIAVICILLGFWSFASAQKKMIKMSLRAQTPFPPVVVNEDYTVFSAKVLEMTGGQIEIKFFPGGTLVPSKEILTAVGSGAIEMGIVPEGYFHKLVPPSEIAQGLPFAFRNLYEARYFMYMGGFLEILRESYAKQNVYVIPHETYNIGLMTKMPLTKAEDFKGKKFRAYGTMAEWLGKLGSTTAFIPSAELYTALATGVVDGAHWGDAASMYSMKFQEVTKNYIMPEPIIGTWNSLIVNMDLWKRLSPEQRAQIEAASLAYNAFWVHTGGRLQYIRALAAMQDEWGVQVNQIPDTEIKKMREVAYKVWEDIEKKDPLNKKAIDLLRKFLQDKNVDVKQVNVKK